MIKRTIDISHPAYLKRKQSQLVIDRPNEKGVTIPFEDLGVLILSHPQITITQGVIEACSDNNCVIIHCNRKQLPTSLTLPFSSHTLHTKALRTQINLKQIRRKQLWQQIIQAKISEQAETLNRFDKNHKPIKAMVNRVKSGDKDNLEAQAAQQYWKLLMGNKFRRNPDLDGVNEQLNYGYAILRGVIARAIVGTGFHPSIGINHSNQYNAYCLADDLIEPYRPWIDEITLKQTTTELNQNTKSHYLNLLGQEVLWCQKKIPFMVAIALMVAQFKQAYEDNAIILEFPKRIGVYDDFRRNEDDVGDCPF